MEKITRRSILSGAPAVGLAAVPAVGLAAIVPASAGDNSIINLFRQWRAVRDEDWSGLPDVEAERLWRRYDSLRRSIEECRPTTATELAMQFIVMTDDGDSEYPADFLSKARALAVI